MDEALIVSDGNAFIYKIAALKLTWKTSPGP